MGRWKINDKILLKFVKIYKKNYYKKKKMKNLLKLPRNKFSGIQSNFG